NQAPALRPLVFMDEAGHALLRNGGWLTVSRPGGILSGSLPRSEAERLGGHLSERPTSGALPLRRRPCATSAQVEVTGQRIGRVSSMSDGASQLFDPDEAAVPDAGGAEPEDRRGVHSIGGVYEQVEGALNQAFPRNRHLWVRGEIQHVSDHRSGHLYMSLIDPEDDGPRRD